LELFVVRGPQSRCVEEAQGTPDALRGGRDGIHVLFQQNGHARVEMSTAAAPEAAAAAAGEELANGLNGGEGGDGGEQSQEEQKEVDIVINNVVGSFSVKCHLNLRDIALRGHNVEYRRENGMVTMKLRRPYTTASMWSSGKITCTGANSEDQAKVAARRYTRLLQKLGFNVKFRNFRVVNVLGTCTMPFAIKITQFSQKYKEASYEPELHPGVTYKIQRPKATLKIFSTGSITVTAPSVANVQSAIEKIYPLVYEFRKPKEKSVNRRSNSGEGEEDFVEYGGAGTVRRGPLNYRSIHKGRGRMSSQPPQKRAKKERAAVEESDPDDPDDDSDEDDDVSDDD